MPDGPVPTADTNTLLGTQVINPEDELFTLSNIRSSIRKLFDWSKVVPFESRSKFWLLRLSM